MSTLLPALEGQSVNLSRNEAYGWHFQYLTVIGLTLATVTFAIGLLADITLSPRLFLAKNLLSICSTPLEVLISILYWGLRLVCNPSLSMRQFLTIFRLIHAWLSQTGHIFLSMPVSTLPVSVGDFANSSVDLSFHAVPAIVMLIDLLLLSPPWTITIFPAIGLSSTIAFGYWFWIERCYAHNGWYERPRSECERG